MAWEVSLMNWWVQSAHILALCIWNLWRILNSLSWSLWRHLALPTLACITSWCESSLPFITWAHSMNISSSRCHWGIMNCLLLCSGFLSLLIFFSEFFHHQLKLFLVLFKVSFQILYIFVFVIDSTLQTAHCEKELLDLEAKMVKARFNFKIFSNLRIRHAPSLHLLLIVS